MVESARAFADEAAANRASAGPLRDAIVENNLRRVKHLSIGDEPLVFGRIDTTHPDTHHIGRVAIYDVEHEPLVTDWRAPAAEPFYRATPREPLGVIRRRHIMCRGQKVVHLEDELLDAAHEDDEGLVLVGEAALLHALNRSRGGRMRDIVATIQREQDEVIRAPLAGVLVVQGGPGTGKTAVALHRAAYLLYTHRERLSRSGVLVVGPNGVFLRYIEQVLPTLGESATLASVGEIVPGVRATRADQPDVAHIKGDPRMATVIERAVNDLERALESPATITYEGTPIKLSVAASRHMVKVARQKLSGTHNAKAPAVREIAIGFLFNKWVGKQGRFKDLLRNEEQREDFELAMRENDDFKRALEVIWPARSGEDLVGSLLGDAPALARAADGVLDDAEQALLLRARPDGWSEGDVALIDEAGVLLGPLRVRRRRRPKLDPEERFHIERLVDELQELNPIIRSERRAFVQRLIDQRLELESEDDEHKRPPREIFGHVVIDEAQSLSPMQWRMLARRCPSRSMTIVGDVGQNVGVWDATWDDVVAQISPPSSRISELSINYRSPEPIAEMAARILHEAAPGLVPPRSVRTDGEPPRFVLAASGDLVSSVAEIARSEHESEGTVAVICAVSSVPSLREALGIDPLADPASLLDEPVAVLSVDDARGLEFDVVIVVEPAAIVRECAGGLRALYVALTRATARVVVVHAEDLPAAMMSSTPSDLRRQA
jgi:DNA helicase IV